MNKYGNFIYDDFPKNASTTFSKDYTEQTASGILINDALEMYFGDRRVEPVDWATFEGEGLDFDKWVYNDDGAPVIASSQHTIPPDTAHVYMDVPNTDVYSTDTEISVEVLENDEWVVDTEKVDFVEVEIKGRLYADVTNYTYEQQIVRVVATSYNKAAPDISQGQNDDFSLTITPDETYSGYGITLRTMTDDYQLSITATDESGTHIYQFDKTEDEYYGFSYDGLTSLVLTFTPSDNHFLKIIGYRLGSTRILDDDVWYDEPEIITHFSLTGEEIEYDILTLSIQNNGKFNFIEGQKIQYSRTRQVFYIAEVDSDFYATKIKCYDDVSRLEEVFTGAYSVTANIDVWLPMLLKGNTDDIYVIYRSIYMPIANWVGVIPIMSYREAARQLMFTTGLRLLRHGDSKFETFALEYANYFKDCFTDDNIVSTPEIQYGERYGEIDYLRHYYKVAQNEDRQEIFNGYVLRTGEQLITWNEPHHSPRYYYVSGTDAQGNDEYTAVKSSKFTVKEFGAYHAIVENDYTQRIAIFAYPIKESTYKLKQYTDVPTIYKNNVKETSSTSMLGYTDYNDLFRFLKKVYSYYITISFESLRYVQAGTYVELKFDGRSYEGWVTQVKDRANGKYEYEVLCK